MKWLVGILSLGVLGACASGGRCNTDSCYRDRAATTDAFEDGEVAAWGVTEKQDHAKRKEQRRELASEKARSK